MPVVGVGAVVIASDRKSPEIQSPNNPSNQNPLVVLIRRGKAPLQGQWSLPGGAVELGETLEAATIRELREETALDVKPIHILKVLNKIHRDADGRVQYHYVLVDFLCQVVEGTLRAGSDAAEACWASVADLERLSLNPETLAVIHQALQDYPALLDTGMSVWQR